MGEQGLAKQTCWLGLHTLHKGSATRRPAPPHAAFPLPTRLHSLNDQLHGCHHLLL